jgi:hypothetical protein
VSKRDSRTEGEDDEDRDDVAWKQDDRQKQASEREAEDPMAVFGAQGPNRRESSPLNG